jgi:hypothetical protein
MRTKTPLLTEQLRRAIATSGETRYAISKATGVGQDTLCRFVNGERGLSMEAMNALGQYLGLELVRKQRRRKAKKGR